MEPSGATDYWCNLFTPEGLRRLYIEAPEFAWVVKNWSLGDRLKGCSPQEFIELMDKIGFSHIGIPATQVYSYVNRRLIWDVKFSDITFIVDAFPDRFFGLYGINPLLRMKGVKELEHAVRNHNFVASIMHPHGFGIRPGEADWYPFYAKCAELDIPIFTLVGHAAEEMPSEPGRPIHLEKVALYFPELKIVGCSGWPWVEEMIAMAWKFPNVFYGTSQFAPRFWPKSLVDFVRGRGKGKVLFGTGFPALGHEEAIKQINELNLSEAAKRNLLRDVAEQVLWGGNKDDKQKRTC